MAAFISEIQSLIGAPPAGYEWLQYLVVAVLLIFLSITIIFLHSTAHFCQW